MAPNYPLFNHSVRRIERAYSDLGHTLGWRFLYTSKSTFSKQAPLWFLGLNPGGRKYGVPSPCTKGANGYRLERWGGATEPNQLQRQVIALYELIAEQCGWDLDELMDQSLAANFCPFRSPSWAKLRNKAATVEFCTGLWQEIVPKLRPRVIVTIAPPALKQFRLIHEADGYTLEKRDLLPAGWGSVKCVRMRLRKGNDEVLLVRFPHFSHFPIIGRKASMSTVRKLVKEIAGMIE